MDQHVQKAVDCYNAGATVLHLHVRELDGKGSKRLSMFNELLARLRDAVPDMILQVGGSISFAPEGEGADAKWLSDDTRHMLAELTPTPDQVTIAINTNQMNIVEQMNDADIAGTSLAEPMLYQAYREMTIPAGPEWVEEHIRRLSEKGIQTHFQLANITQLETVERMMRRGTCNVPLILTWVAIGGGFDAPNIYNLANFVRATPDGAVLTLESSMLNVLPINMMAMAMGLHVRCGIEDNIWNQRRTAKMGSVEQIEQLVRISREFGRDIANGKEARRIYRIGEFYRLGRRDAGQERLRAEPQARAARPAAARGRVSGDVRGNRPDRPGPSRRRRRALADTARRTAAAGPLGAADGPGRPRLRRARIRHRAGGAGGRGAARHRRAQRRGGDAGALGAAAPAARSSARSWRRRPTSSGRCRKAIRASPTLEAGGWLPVPRERLPFPSIVAASRNDPLGSFDRVAELARGWGSRLVDLGEVGHLNPASGFGEWPMAETLIAELEAGGAAVA